MPNWASTDYVFKGRDEEQAKQLEACFDELKEMQEPFVENGFGNLWMDCVVNKLGGNWEEVFCRGEIQDYNRNGDELRIYCITAWGEMPEFRRFIEKKFPESKMYYCVYEPGFQVYATNDADGVYYPSRYIIESDLDTMFAETIEEAAKCVGEYLEKEIEPDLEKIKAAVDEFVNGLTDSEEDKYKFLNFIDVDIEED